jgi:lipoprotein signal peptidase
MRPLHRLGIGCAVLVIILDQLSKPLMRDWLSGGDIYVAPFFNLVSAWN